MKKQYALSLVAQHIDKNDYPAPFNALMKVVAESLHSDPKCKVYTDGLVLEELINIYEKRLMHLKDSDCKYAGLSETIFQLKAGHNPSCMISMDTSSYHIVILLNDNQKIIGAFLIEQ